MAGLDAHDRVGLWVERRIPAKHFDGDRVCLDAHAAAGQKLFNDIAEEAPLAGCCLEVCALQNAVDLLPTVSRRETVVPCREHFRLAHRILTWFGLRDLAISRLF